MELISSYGLERWLSGQENLGLVLSTRMRNLMSVLCRHCTHMVYRHTCRPNTYTKIKVNLKMFVLSRKQLFFP